MRNAGDQREMIAWGLSIIVGIGIEGSAPCGTLGAHRIHTSTPPMITTAPDSVGSRPSDDD